MNLNRKDKSNLSRATELTNESNSNSNDRKQSEHIMRYATIVCYRLKITFTFPEIFQKSSQALFYGAK